jgi:hypothetical protein
LQVRGKSIRALNGKVGSCQKDEIVRIGNRKGVFQSSANRFGLAPAGPVNAVPAPHKVNSREIWAEECGQICSSVQMDNDICAR